jgi:hypothetical protein
MQWLVCRQLQNDLVRYRTNDMAHNSVMQYKKFINMVHELRIIDYVDFRDELNKFKIIFIDCIKHSWEIHIQEKEDASFEELWELNREKEEITKEDTMKNFIQKFSKIQSNKSFKEDVENNNKR